MPLIYLIILITRVAPLPRARPARRPQARRLETLSRGPRDSRETPERLVHSALFSPLSTVTSLDSHSIL